MTLTEVNYATSTHIMLSPSHPSLSRPIDDEVERDGKVVKEGGGGGGGGN